MLQAQAQPFMCKRFFLSTFFFYHLFISNYLQLNIVPINLIIT